MVFDQPVRALWLEQKGERQVRSALCRSNGVKGKVGMRWKALHGAGSVDRLSHARSPRRQLPQQWFGQTQHFGRERFDNRRERLALLNSGDNLRSPLPVATNGVTIVEPTYD